MARLSNTTVRFIQGVPFDNSYAHTRWFTTRTQQYNYFTSFPNIVRTRNNFQKSTGRFAIDVSEHVEKMMNYDYLMYRNADYGGKWFYGFILNVEYLDARTTRVYFEVDPIQTYMFDVEFKQSYVVREHEHDNPENIYPEGLQIGSEYETVHTWDIKPYPFYFMVVATKDYLHNDPVGSGSYGTHYGVPDPLTYYVLPIPRNAESNTRFYGTHLDGSSTYTTGGWASTMTLLDFLRNNQKAVNNVVSIYVTDYLPLSTTRLEGGHYRIDNTRMVTLEGDLEQNIFMVDSETNAMYDFPDLQKQVGNVFQTINENDSKLRYFPYTLIELSDARGNIVNYKPEGLLNRNGDITLRIMGGLTYQNTVAYGLQGYNGNNSRSGVLENAIINTDPQDLPILTDQAAAYLQGAKNSMQAKRNTWESQQGYQARQALIRGGQSAGNILGGAIGMGMNSLNLGYGINMLSTGLGNLAQSGNDFMQSGIDYQNKINEQNAQVEDLMNLPPSLQKQGNNPSMNIGYDMQGVRIRIKRVRSQYLKRTRQYLRIFGTKVNTLKVPNIRTRRRFNYVQTTMLNIQSPIYNDDIMRFKYIFDQGITLWHTDDMYNYNIGNLVR